MSQVKFMTLDPGHFHAGLVQKEMYQGVSKQIHVYAPLGSDLTAHLNRIIAFNNRKENPTAWELEVHTGPDFMARMLHERPGNVVVISGRNRGKIDRIKASVDAGLNVLADKPWIIEPADLPKLESALNTADQKGLIAYDIMTERYEITSILQKELLNDSATFGTALARDGKRSRGLHGIGALPLQDGRGLTSPAPCLVLRCESAGRGPSRRGDTPGRHHPLDVVS